MVGLIKRMFYQIRHLKLATSSVFLIILVILFVSSCSPWLYYESQYDNFESLDRIIESPQKDFLIGDQIILTARITSDKPTNIRMYKDRTKSFRISIRRWLKNRVDYDDNDYFRGFPPATDNDEIEVVNINPNSQFRFQIKGKFEVDKQGRYIFNFNKFGKFKKRKLGEYSVLAEWRNLDPIPGQEMEEMYTNSLIINAEAPKLNKSL
jgi:hypothetical protein